MEIDILKGLFDILVVNGVIALLPFFGAPDLSAVGNARYI